MKHRIDPKVDCVFKAILGAEDNRNLLVHFLNAVLDGELADPIAEVAILNPYNERETLDDKLSIVDVKATDRAGRLFQIEIQLSVYGSLAARMLYTWCDIYSQQLASSQDYRELKPTYSVWLLGKPLQNEGDYAHDYKPRDQQGQSLIEHGGIFTFELAKLPDKAVASEGERWLRFFKEGENLDDEALPQWMQTDEMRQVMETIRQFSEKERQYHAYQARQNFLREQRAIQADLESARQQTEQARQETEQARQQTEQARSETEEARRAMEAAKRAEEQERREKEAALAEIERLKAELEQRNGP